MPRSTSGIAMLRARPRGHERVGRRLPSSLARWVTAIALGLGLLTSDDIVARADPLGGPGPELSAYAGRWVKVEDAAAEAARLSAIDAAVADLSWLVRGMAAGVLRRSAVPPGTLAFEWRSGVLQQIVEGSEGRFERPVRPGEPPLQLTDPNGEPFTASWKRTPNGLEVHWAQARATGMTRYRFEAEGNALVAAHRIEVTALDGLHPIEYESRFERVEGLPSISAAPSTRVAAPATGPHGIGAPASR